MYKINGFGQSKPRMRRRKIELCSGQYERGSGADTNCITVAASVFGTFT
jgi:hypothetical protein